MKIKAVRAAAADFVFVVAFVVIGRKSHGHGESVRGIFSTSWPFLVGLIGGWLVSRDWKSPTQVLPTGVIVWLLTVALGQILRVIVGQGTALPFILVSLAFLGLFLLGSRIVLGLIDRKLERSRT
ncbi:MAG: DUF3054 domain-containing protein [Actinomycetota bacterium]|nr:DUF3054 domain-containing protein [Actinomycetota bacterium]